MRQLAETDSNRPSGNLPHAGGGVDMPQAATGRKHTYVGCTVWPACAMLLDDQRSSNVSSSIGTRHYHKLPDRHPSGRCRRVGCPAGAHTGADWPCPVGSGRIHDLYWYRVLDDGLAACLLYRLGRSSQRVGAKPTVVAAIGLGASSRTAACADICCPDAIATLYRRSAPVCFGVLW
jgi:hypothetical protein